MLESVIALELKAKDDDTLNFPDDPIKFLRTLNNTKVHALYESEVFSFTISKNTLANVPDYRRAAIEIKNTNDS